MLFSLFFLIFFFFNDTATTEIYTLSLHDALTIRERPHSLRRFAGPALAFLLRAVEAAHLLERGAQAVTRKRRVGDQPVAPVANLVADRGDDSHPVGLDEGEVAVAGRDEPLPRQTAEEVLAARVVRGRIRTAEYAGEQGRRHVEVRGATRDAPRGPPGPAHEKRDMQLKLAVRRA